MSEWAKGWMNQWAKETQLLLRPAPAGQFFSSCSHYNVQCILRPPGANPHSRKVAASPMLPCAQACQYISSQVAIPPSTDAPSNRCHFVKSTPRKSGAGVKRALPTVSCTLFWPHLPKMAVRFFVGTFCRLRPAPTETQSLRDPHTSMVSSANSHAPGLLLYNCLTWFGCYDDINWRRPSWPFVPNRIFRCFAFALTWRARSVST